MVNKKKMVKKTVKKKSDKIKKSRKSRKINMKICAPLDSKTHNDSKKFFTCFT